MTKSWNRLCYSLCNAGIIIFDSHFIRTIQLTGWLFSNFHLCINSGNCLCFCFKNLLTYRTVCYNVVESLFFRFNDFYFAIMSVRIFNRYTRCFHSCCHAFVCSSCNILCVTWFFTSWFAVRNRILFIYFDHHIVFIITLGFTIRINSLICTLEYSNT